MSLILPKKVQPPVMRTQRARWRSAGTPGPPGRLIAPEGQTRVCNNRNDLERQEETSEDGPRHARSSLVSSLEQDTRISAWNSGQTSENARRRQRGLWVWNRRSTSEKTLRCREDETRTGVTCRAGKDVTRSASYERQGFITFPRPHPSLLLADTLARMSNTGLWHSQALGLPDLTVSLLRAQH